MKITRKSIFILLGINVLSPLVFLLFWKASIFLEDPGILWQIPLTMLVLSGIAAFISVFVIVCVQKPKWENHIYFFGQFAPLLVLTGFIAYNYIDGVIYRSTKANIDNNRQFAIGMNHDNDSLRLKAILKLESVFENPNDFSIDYSNFVKKDTVINSIHDSVGIAVFTYTIRQWPGKFFFSKHLVGEHINEMLFYNIPLTSSREVNEKITSLNNNFHQTLIELREYCEEMKRTDSNNETLQKFEKELKALEESEPGNKSIIINKEGREDRMQTRP